ncbi:glycosyltransferase [Paenibacillus sp. LjRoot153]|uniref:glycosyltransferase n=1 Tax=Paenibacillus sp. LjRoot153 TaxID=3342270 RepID=UPI003ECF9887
MKKIIKRYLPINLTRILMKYVKKYYLFQNINLDETLLNQKRVLISYITDPISRDQNTWYTHTNIAECSQIIRCFIEMDYIIDLIHCEDHKGLNSIINRKYDVVFGLGRPFYEISKQNLDAKKIIYLTESHPEFSLKQETERMDYYYERNKKRLKHVRSNAYLKNDYINIADIGILIGNKFTLQTYRQFNYTKDIFTITPTGMRNRKYINGERNYNSTKKNFLWFGSSGAIHKGLDVIVEAFREIPDCNLYIGGLHENEKRFINLKGHNIIDLGFVNIQSDAFLELINTCSFVILPSCSEGMATSVLTCMNHGLIPIITKETGIDLIDSGFYLHDYRVEYLKDFIKDCSRLPDEIIADEHVKVYNYAKDIFNISNYSKQLKKTLQDVLHIKG